MNYKIIIDYLTKTIEEYNFNKRLKQNKEFIRKIKIIEEVIQRENPHTAFIPFKNIKFKKNPSKVKFIIYYISLPSFTLFFIALYIISNYVSTPGLNIKSETLHQLLFVELFLLMLILIFILYFIFFKKRLKTKNQKYNNTIHDYYTFLKKLRSVNDEQHE